MNIEDKLFPNRNKLIIDGETLYAHVIDAELDPIEIRFGNDGCAEIITEGYTYLTLTYDNLETILTLIDEADEYYAENDVFKEQQQSGRVNSQRKE